MNPMPIELQIENAINSLLQQVIENPATEYTVQQAHSIEALANALRILRSAEHA